MLVRAEWRAFLRMADCGACRVDLHHSFGNRLDDRGWIFSPSTRVLVTVRVRAGEYDVD